MSAVGLTGPRPDVSAFQQMPAGSLCREPSSSVVSWVLGLSRDTLNIQVLTCPQLPESS